MLLKAIREADWDDSWHRVCSQQLRDMGFTPSRADPDVWFKAAVKPGGIEYYEYILVYVDDILSISHDPMKAMTQIGEAFSLKEPPARPSRYLGANVTRWQLPDGRVCWATSSDDYVKNAVKIVKQQVTKEGTQWRLGKTAERPMPEKYRPELDATEELDDKLANRYLQYIGILRWAVELGRVDILLEVSLLSTMMAQPRRGHLEAVYSIFMYLDKHENSTMAYDHAYPNIDETVFTDPDWTDFYGDISEEIPLDAPAT